MPFFPFRSDSSEVSTNEDDTEQNTVLREKSVNIVNLPCCLLICCSFLNLIFKASYPNGEESRLLISISHLHRHFISSNTEQFLKQLSQKDK